MVESTIQSLVASISRFVGSWGITTGLAVVPLPPSVLHLVLGYPSLLGVTGGAVAFSLMEGTRYVAGLKTGWRRAV